VGLRAQVLVTLATGLPDLVERFTLEATGATRPSTATAHIHLLPQSDSVTGAKTTLGAGGVS